MFMSHLYRGLMVIVALLVVISPAPSHADGCSEHCIGTDSIVAPTDSCCFRINITAGSITNGTSDVPCPQGKCTPCKQTVTYDFVVSNCPDPTLVGWLTSHQGTQTGRGHTTFAPQLTTDCGVTGTSADHSYFFGTTGACTDEGDYDLNCTC